MKIRVGFVSNSSSSSYIVIGNVTPTPPDVDGVYKIGINGETEFGWGPYTICDMDSRINFAWLQACYLDEENKNDDYKNMVLDSVKKNTGALAVEYRLLTSYDLVYELKVIQPDIQHGYIDHQSCAYEGENTEMFDSEDSLTRFLFSRDSRIVLDNDNR